MFALTASFTFQKIIVSLQRNQKCRDMDTMTMDKPKKKIIDWINPHSDEVTLEEYRSEMQTAESSGFISFE